jgi:hypothetical protein
MNAYEAKQAARRERLEAKAASTRAEADARASRAFNSVRGLQGEPIKVGHHSERKHRNLLERSDNDMRKAGELYRHADKLESRADGVGRAGISSDDPEAVVKLERKVEALERNHAFMKRANELHWKNGKPGPANDAAWLAIEEQLGVEAGYFNSHRSLISRERWLGDKPFASFSLSNNNANIKHTKARLEEVRNLWQAETKALDVKEGVKLVENVEENRVQLIFDGKPEADTRALLKRHGFRWSPRNGAWQRHLNGNGIYAAKQVIAALK